MKYNIKQSSLLMLFALFLVAFCFIACDDQDNEEQEQVGQLTPEALYQTSWRGTGHCAAWSLKETGAILHLMILRFNLPGLLG